MRRLPYEQQLSREPRLRSRSARRAEARRRRHWCRLVCHLAAREVRADA